jgi:PAS domain S-box-containing protein
MLTAKPGLTSLRATQSRKVVSFRSLLTQAKKDSKACLSDEFDQIVLTALEGVRELKLVEASGFYSIVESGALTNLCSIHNSSDLESIATQCVHDLPWCLPKLLAGQPVVLQNMSMPITWLNGRRQTRGSGESLSIVLIPSRNPMGPRGLFILLSIPSRFSWSSQKIEECALLVDFLWSARQCKHAPDEGSVNGQRLIRLLCVSAVGMAVVDENGILTAANPAFFKATGYAERQLLMRPFDLVFRPALQCDGINIWQRARHMRNSIRQVERTIARKDGSSVTARIAVTPLLYSRESPVHFLVIIGTLGEIATPGRPLDLVKCRESSIASRLIQYQEEERKRLSRDLHDGLGQSMSLIASECALLATEYSGLTPSLGDRLASLRDRLDGACSELHSMSHNLHSFKLRHLGLTCALKDMCRQLSTQEIKVTLNIDNAGDPLSEEVSLCLYRVAQEAIGNCVKHSQSRKILVTLTELRNTFYMTVKDYGIGFNTHARFDGLGLVSMKERLSLVNGRLKISSTIGGGTEIWASISEQPDLPAVGHNKIAPTWRGDRVAGAGRQRRLARA